MPHKQASVDHMIDWFHADRRACESPTRDDVPLSRVAVPNTARGSVERLLSVCSPRAGGTR